MAGQRQRKPLLQVRDRRGRKEEEEEEEEEEERGDREVSSEGSFILARLGLEEPSRLFTNPHNFCA